MNSITKYPSTNRQPLSIQRSHPGNMNQDHNTPLFALDFETTGLSPSFDRVVEIGLAGPRPYHALISDAPPSSPGAQACHGITQAELQRKGLPEEEAFQGLLEALGEGPVRIVCHNALFERSFLEQWAKRLGRELPGIQWLCSLELAREVCRDFTLPRALENLAWLLGLDHGALHRAPADAELTLKVHEALQAWAQVKGALGDRDFLVYLAGPLRGDGTAEDIRHNQTRMLLQARWAQAVLPKATLMVPHANFAFLDESQDRDGRIRGLALRGCEKVLSRCDAMVLCGRELSPGMAMEQRLAKNLRIPTLQVPGWDGRPAVEAREEGVA